MSRRASAPLALPLFHARARHTNPRNHRRARAHAPRPKSPPPRAPGPLPTARDESSSDALGLGGLDLAQYVQKAQAFLQARASEKAADGEAGETDLATLMKAALGKQGSQGGEGEAAAEAQPEA